MADVKIMVVEDEGIVALDIQSKLERMGYEVSAVVSSGEEAVEKAGAMHPDLALMDIQLDGEMDGIEAADQIRSRFDIPVVYLTAFSDENTLQRAKISEPFGYLLKPFEERKMHTTIEIALYKHRVEREKEHLEAQLHQARKMEAIGRLTAGIAYNFTNMLQGIQGNLDLALIEASDEIRPFLDAADFDAQRAAQLIKQLMLFYQREQLEREEIQLAVIAEEVVTTCRQVFARKYGRRIDIVLQCDADLPPVQGDPAQLRQCLTAFCTNAGDSLDKLEADDSRIPHIEISIESIRFSESDHLPEPDAGEKQHLRISIADNGVGIDQEEQEHLFEPFFDRQETERSTGLGLAVVYAIVHEHHGWIECESEPGTGTTFHVYLPAASARRQVQTAADAAVPQIIIGDDSIFDVDRLRGTEKVLIIADVDRFRKILSEMLERHGYEVLVGLDVNDGLNVFRFEKDNIDLVVLDLSTPGMSSQEILNQLSSIAADVRVLVATGYTIDSSPWQGASAVLNKPFKTHRFLSTVRQVLDSSTGID